VTAKQSSIAAWKNSSPSSGRTRVNDLLGRQPYLTVTLMVIGRASSSRISVFHDGRLKFRDSQRCCLRDRHDPNLNALRSRHRLGDLDCRVHVRLHNRGPQLVTRHPLWGAP
jgi:hypothetical protein